MRIFRETLLVLVVLTFNHFPIFSQSKYLYKSDGFEILFPRKPLLDTSISEGQSKIKMVFGVDSISNFYFGINDIIDKEILASSNIEGINDYIRGFLDGYLEKYKGEIISQQNTMINSIKGNLYHIVGTYRQQKVRIVMWVFIKNQKLIYCQHLYLEQHDSIVKERQNSFIKSLKITNL